MKFVMTHLLESDKQS